MSSFRLMWNKRNVLLFTVKINVELEKCSVVDYND